MMQNNTVGVVGWLKAARTIGKYTIIVSIPPDAPLVNSSGRIYFLEILSIWRSLWGSKKDPAD